MVPAPPLVIQRRPPCSARRRAAHIWCRPTSVVTTASAGRTAPSASSAASPALAGAGTRGCSASQPRSIADHVDRSARGPGAKASSRPVTRSSKRAPTATMQSAACSAQ